MSGQSKSETMPMIAWDLVKEVRAALESDVSELRPQKLTRL